VQKFIPTDSQLINMLPHIHHEICQVTEAIWSSAASRNDISSNTCPAKLEYALWESCLIHVRILLDFFEFEKRRTRYDREMDDVLSLDYGFQAQKVEITHHYRERINKDLAHLTYSKAERTFNESLLPIANILSPLLKRCSLFCEHILSADLMNHIPQFLLAWETLLERINSLIELINQSDNKPGPVSG
jgi:hypothetical protein